jgi:hypothetical protein
MREICSPCEGFNCPVLLVYQAILIELGRLFPYPGLESSVPFPPSANLRERKSLPVDTRLSRLNLQFYSIQGTTIRRAL